MNFNKLIILILSLLTLIGCNKNEKSWQDAMKKPDCKVLYLIGAHINSIPIEVNKFSRLEELNLNFNNLDIIPDYIFNLKNLKILVLNSNQIRYIPPTIGFMNKLEYLSLTNNKLDSLPDQIANLKGLKILHLEGNNINEERQNRLEKLLPQTKIYFDFNETYYPGVFYYNKGIAFLQDGEFNYALKYMNKAIKELPDESETYVIRGVINYNLKNNQAACIDWYKAKEMKNKNADLYIITNCR